MLLLLKEMSVKNSCLYFLFFFIGLCFHAQSQILSPNAKVSLVTIGPGTDLYSGFGHSALWIYDPQAGIDRAYNYGTFSFETGNFYIKFLRGTLPYTLSVAPLEPQVRYWQAENRYVEEQVLNLSPEQKEKLLSFLENNYLPENREYQYKFFYDNCSTRLRDALMAACGDNIVFDGYNPPLISFRQWIDKYAYVQNPWADFGMDLAIGSPSDDIATAMQAMFLPENLLQAFDEAKIKHGDQILPLVSSKNSIFKNSPVVTAGSVTPKSFFWSLMILVAALTYFQLNAKKVNFVFDKILFSIIGLTGWILFLLWFATNHGDTKWNSDLLWAVPLWLPVIFYLSARKETPEWFQFVLIFYAFLVMAATLNLEKHNQVVVPILLILIIRIYYINESLKKLSRQRSQDSI